MKLYRSERASRLVDALADVLRRPAVGPLGEETVVVGADGVRRWLQKQLAERLGVCARVRFPYARAVVDEAVAAVAGGPAPEDDPWREEVLPWGVLAALPRALADPRLEPLRTYLGGGAGDEAAGLDLGGLRAFELARRVARVFARYLADRPELLLAWDAGDDAGAAGEAWQPVLWRALGRQLGDDHPAARAARFHAAAERARSGDGPPLALPPGLRRVCVFGVSSLPRAQVRALARLAEAGEVHLFVVCPVPATWAARHAAARARPRGAPRADGGLEPSADDGAAAHPLEASLGGLARDLQALLEREVEGLGPGVELPDPPRGASALARLQRDVAGAIVRGPAGAPPHALDPDDGSLRLHACHGDMRQVEVLEDQLRELFRRDPTLEPGDVLVLTPDVEAFAPLVDAVFGREDGRGPRIPVRVADRPRASQGPLAGAVLRVLALAGRRLTATRVLELLELEPVRRRFGLTADDALRLAAWARGAGVRWGVDAEDRARHGQPALAQNTWRWGLDRLLLARALPGRDLETFAGLLPADASDGPDGAAAGDAALLGRLTDLTDALFRHLRALEAAPRAPAAWAEALRALLLDLVSLDDPGGDDGEGARVLEALDLLERAPAAAGFALPVRHEVPRALLADLLDRSRAATAFLTGAVTLCGMVPMRSVDVRVVCLLGLDDARFPRAGAAPGFDLAARRPAVGDRSPREDDRYLFFEALLSARDAVRCFYTGQSPRGAEALPPSVVLSELLDVLGDSLRLPARPGEDDAATRRRTLEQLVVRHPLQPFSPRAFREGGDPRLASHARDWLDGARALTGTPAEPTAFWAEPLPAPSVPAPGPTTVALADLVAGLTRPTAALLRGRLGLAYPRRSERDEDREPLALDPLARHHVGALLAGALLAGAPWPRAAQAARAGGALPPGTPGDCALVDLEPSVAAFAAAARARRGARVGQVALPPLEVDLTLEPPPGAAGAVGPWRLTGSVGDLWPGGRVVVAAGGPRARHDLALWATHLALCAAEPGAGWRSALVHRRAEAPWVEVRALGPVDDAAALLADLLLVHALGRRAPLPLFPEASAAYARAALAGKPREDALAAAAKGWRAGEHAPGEGEGDDPFVLRAFGPEPPFGPGRREGAPEPWEALGPGLDFEALALRVLAPMLRHLRAEAP